MKISEVARKAGVGVETVRFYERRHLLRQPTSPANGGFRDYPEEAVGRIKFIRRAQHLGFSLREVEELLSLRADPALDCGTVRERATAKQQEISEKIEDLIRIRDALGAVIDACPGSGGVRACSIIGELEKGRSLR